MARPATPLWLARFDAGSDPQLDLSESTLRMAEPRPGTGERSAFGLPNRSSSKLRTFAISFDASRRRPTFRRSPTYRLRWRGTRRLARSEYPLEKLVATILYGAPFARIVFRLRVNGLGHRRQHALSHRRQPRQRSRPGSAGREPAIAEAAEPILERRAERLFNTRLKRRCVASRISSRSMSERPRDIGHGRQSPERGHSLVWFPESWRSPDGKLQRFLPGVGHLLEHPVPVIPAYIEGTFEAMPRDRSWPRRFR